MKSRLPLLVLPLCLAPFALSAQSAAAKAAFAQLSPKAADSGFAASALASAASLGTIDDELWLLEMLAAKASAADQKKILVTQRASMLELAGRYGDAAAVWESAVTMIPGKSDAGALLSAAACRLASGDIDGASGLVTALSFTAAEAETRALADVLAGWVALSRGDRQRAAAAAQAGSDSASLRVAIAALFLGVAATDGADRDTFRGMLSRRYPALTDEAAVSALSLLTASTAAEAVLTTPAIATTAERPAAPSAVEGDAAAAVRYYQVGAFRDQANARALAQKLEKLGLVVSYRLRSKMDLYVVFVETGADTAATILRLKDAGYEAWPLDEAP